MIPKGSKHNLALSNADGQASNSGRSKSTQLMLAMLVIGLFGIIWIGIQFSNANTTDDRFAFLQRDTKPLVIPNSQDSNSTEPSQISALITESSPTDTMASNATDSGPNSPVENENIQARQAEETSPVVNLNTPPEAQEPETIIARSVPIPPPIELDMEDAVIEDRIRDDVTYLASDKLEGRGTRTYGLHLAGEHLADEFRQAGLRTDWIKGTPFQKFELLTASRRGAVQTVQLHTMDDRLSLTPNVDFSSLLRTATGKQTFPIAFVGFGITARELNYDDYANFDVKGKAVIVLRREPQRTNPNSIFNGTENTSHASVYAKIQNAIEHEAAAVILCDDESPDGSDDNPYNSNLLKVEFEEKTFNSTIPVIHCRRALVDELMAAHGADSEQAIASLHSAQQQIDETVKPLSFDLPKVQASFGVSNDRVGRTVRNVIASIEPAEPTNKTILIGAHYDHLGRDGWGSLAVSPDGEIHNGADDNASGTATMIEIARQLASRRQELKVRILFVAFTAEELGLLGSKHYVRDPVVPLKDTIAMINLDMVGRLRDSCTVYGIGTATQWNDVVTKSASEFKLKVSGRSSGYGPSDHAVFYERGIPVLHFFTGFHNQYHRPSDDSELLNIQGMQQISRVIVDITHQLAAENAVELTPSNSERSNPLLAIGGTTGRTTQPPKFGVVLAPVSGSGLQINKVLKESVAASNGLRSGDIITHINKSEIKDVGELRTMVSKASPGQKMDFRVLRKKLELEFEVTF